MDYHISLTQLRRKLGYYLKLANTNVIHITKYGKKYAVLCPPIFLEYRQRLEANVRTQ